MKAKAFCVLVVVAVLGCKDNPVPVNPSAAPVLKGCVADADGNPIVDVDITLYGGLDTRWKVASSQTDAKGEYVFDPCRYGAMILDEENQRWDYFIGMTVSRPGFKSANGKSWWDVRVPQIDRHMIKKDFIMVPDKKKHESSNKPDAGDGK
ncbi:MAG TPA: carboxypeptidase-like regulatory domain-containing protein [Sedimentisphaerales bacterium]|nr:carboxypeptidase-like regulatory domain-containing protein [Sedimentisphaerales bacterium]